MAGRGRPKTGGRNFQKGNKFGKGQPKIPAELRDFRSNYLERFNNVMQKISDMTLQEIKAYVAGSDIKGYEAMIASAYSRAISGNTAFWQALQERTLGPVPKELQHTGKDGGAIETDQTIRVIVEEFKE